MEKIWGENMIFGHFSYLVYMLIFTLIPICILWSINFHFLKKNIKVIWMTTVIAIVYQLIVDPFAENWHAWFFSHDKILGVWIFNFPVENILFFVLISVAISSAVLSFIYHQKTGNFSKL